MVTVLHNLYLRCETSRALIHNLNNFFKTNSESPELISSIKVTASTLNKEQRKFIVLALVLSQQAPAPDLSRFVAAPCLSLSWVLLSASSDDMSPCLISIKRCPSLLRTAEACRGSCGRRRRGSAAMRVARGTSVRSTAAGIEDMF